MPKYINIRRGGYIAAGVGLVMCPWKVLDSSSNFTSYLSRHSFPITDLISSYSVFLSSIAGVMLTDYYVIRKGYFSVPDLYSAHRDGPYWYIMGINPKAYVSSHLPQILTSDCIHFWHRHQCRWVCRRSWSNCSNWRNIHLSTQFLRWLHCVEFDLYHPL
jgi:cytosine/uracil/thiamine/allantoin permease